MFIKVTSRIISNSKLDQLILINTDYITSIEPHPHGGERYNLYMTHGTPRTIDASDAERIFKIIGASL